MPSGASPDFRARRESAQVLASGESPLAAFTHHAPPHQLLLGSCKNLNHTRRSEGEQTNTSHCSRLCLSASGGPEGPAAETVAPPAFQCMKRVEQSCSAQ